MLFLYCFIFHSPLSPPSPPHLLSSFSFFSTFIYPCCPSCFPLFSSEYQPEASLLLSNNITHTHPFPLPAHFFCCFYKCMGQTGSQRTRRVVLRSSPHNQQMCTFHTLPLIRFWLLVLPDNLPRCQITLKQHKTSL